MKNVAYCPECGYKNSSDKDNCSNCNTDLSKESIENTEQQEVDKKLISNDLPGTIEGVGIFYFILSFIGGIYLIATAKETIQIGVSTQSFTNPIQIALGISGIITGFIVLILCLGLARVINQNIYIIKR